MALIAENPAFQLVRIATGLKHVHIMIGLQQDQIGILDVLHPRFLDHAEIGGDGELAAARIERIADRFGGVVRDGKGHDIERTDVKIRAGLKQADVFLADIAQLVAHGGPCAFICVDGQIIPAGEYARAGDMVDVLVMSATPIPRTLSLIFYGDLDITTIPDKPKMRREIQTNIVPMNKYNDMLKFIEKEIKDGRQAYLVCPKIDGDDEGAVISAIELKDEISEKLSSVRVGLLHGRLKDAEKNAVMDEFKAGKIDLLVSTTVIEVGVDVPNASVMVIYNAERFGLSQLHQLRGRVGRSDIKSYCFLLSQKCEGIALERLKVIKDNSDGFKISEYDYNIRGGGDFMGKRQSGKTISDLGNLNYDVSAVFLSKKISDEVFESGKNTELIREQAIKKYDKLKSITLN